MANSLENCSRIFYGEDLVRVQVSLGRLECGLFYSQIWMIGNFVA